MIAEPTTRRAFYRTWWFWTIVGVVVVGGVAIGIGAAASGGIEEPIAGDVGGVVRALSF